MEIYIDHKTYQSKLNTPLVELSYPRCDGQAKEIEIGLCDTRAADSLRISYDFDRDGWVIKQASVFDSEEDTFDPDWQEVAFVQAWGRESQPIRNRSR